MILKLENLHPHNGAEIQQQGYVDFTKGNYVFIMADAKKIIEAITKEDIDRTIKSLSNEAKMFNKLSDEEKHKLYGEDIISYFEKLTEDLKDKYTYTYNFILSECRWQLLALEKYNLPEEELFVCAENKTSSICDRPMGWDNPYIDTKSSNVTPAVLPTNDLYTNILQGKATNALVHTTKKSMVQNTIANEGVKKTEDLEIILEDFSNLNLTANTYIVLDMLTEKLSNNLHYSKGNISAEQLLQNRKVSIDISEYMERRKIKDRREAIKQLKTSIYTLFRTEIRYKEVRKEAGKNKKSTNTLNMHILDAIGSKITVHNGSITAHFNVDIAEYLRHSQIMPYPKALSSIKVHKNPHSYYIGRKLCEHYNMNVGKTNANRISVKKLLEALPELPKYDDVIVDSKHIAKLIIDPFERDITALQEVYDVITSWQYCNANGIPLTDEQLDSFRYNDWVEWLIEFDLTEYPDQTERLAEIEKRKSIAKKKKQKAIEKAKKKAKAEDDAD